MKTPGRKRSRPNGGGDFTVAELVERVVLAHLAKMPPPQAVPAAPVATPAPLAYSPRQAARVANLGYVSIYRALKTGELVGRRAARRKTLVLAADLEQWLQGLPKVRP